MIRGHSATEVNSRPVSLCYCSHELWLSQEVLTFISKGFIKCDGVKLKVSDKVEKKKRSNPKTELFALGYHEERVSLFFPFVLEIFYIPNNEWIK